jgi:hypothetical protein
MAFLGLTLFGERKLPGFDNSRIAIDLTTRASYWEEADELTLQEFIGIDYYQILSLDGKDFATLTIQPFIYRIDNGYRTPGFYDDNHDWEFLFRTLNINFNYWGVDKPYIKLGHFELPFGAEYNKNSFGELHQYGQGMKIGMKMDWGVAIGQQIGAWQYEVAMTRGSGMKYRDRENPYAFTGRLGVLDDSNFVYGLSFFSGEVLKGKKTIKRELLALDLEYFWNRVGFLIEIHGGELEEDTLYGSLLECSFSSQDEASEFYVQHFYQNLDNNTSKSNAVVGVKYRVNRELTLSAQILKELESSMDEENLFEVQVRYRF